MTRFNSNSVNSSVFAEKPHRLKKLEILMHELESLSEANFTGYVKVNYSQGSIGRVEKFEEILKDYKVK